MTFPRLFALVPSLAAACVAACFCAAEAAGLTGTVDAADGTPIPGARVVLSGNGAEREARSDANGRFALAGVAPGTYSVAASAKGYNALSGRTIQVLDGSGNQIDLVLPRAQASSLTTIGTVRSNGHATLSTAPGQSLDIAAKPYADQGVTRTSDILEQQLSTTVQPIIGGGMNAPAVVSLRGPDPSETLVDVDGHAVNNGATGDFDLSLLDPADLQSVQVVYGVGPSSLIGPNTLGGALNVRTLEPTAQTHVLERLTLGTYDTTGETVQATGTDDRLGYAFSFHRLTSGGELDNSLFPAAPAGQSGGYSTVGQALDASSTIAKLRYSLFNGAGFVGVSLRDQAAYRDVSATTSSYDTADDTYQSESGSSIASSNAAYGLDAQAPLGRENKEGTYPTIAIFRYQTSFAHQIVNGPAAGSSPYLFDTRDLIGDSTLEIDHAMPHASLALKATLTDENLSTGITTGTTFADTDAVARVPLGIERLDSGGGGGVATAGQSIVIPESLAQTQRSLGLRYTDDPTAKLHYSFATYYSDYSTFGHSIDPRVGFVWTPSGDTAVRVSAGSSFESPELLSLYRPPNSTLDVPSDGYVVLGNPNLTAERATLYDAGYEHEFRIPGHALHLGLDLYRTDLHNGVSVFVPKSPCPSNAPPTAIAYTECVEYPINVAQEVYQGLELHGDLALAAFTTLHASYGVDSVFTKSAPAADDIVPYEQALGVPLQKWSLTIERDPKRLGLSEYAGILYEGAYNELNAPPFATLRAGIAWHLRDLDIGLSATNLTDVYDFKITRVGGGVPYDGTPTDQFPLAGQQFILSFTHHV